MTESYTQAELDLLAQIGISNNIGLFLVPILLGFLLDTVLLGVGITQYLHWWQHSRNDRLFNRVIIVLTGVLIVCTSVFNIAWMMHLFAYGFSHWYRFFELGWVRWNVLLDLVTVTIVQIFYIERLYQLTQRNKVTLALTSSLLVTSFVGGLMACIACGMIPDATQLKKIEPYFYVWVGGTLSCDLVVTTLISYRLIKAKTGWSSTDWLITKLVKLSIESQLPSTIIAIAFMISYGVRPVDGLNIFFEIFHPKIYVVALMALLNARGTLRVDGSPNVSESKKDNTYNVGGTGPTQQTVVLDQITYTDAGVTFPSLIIDIDRTPRDVESVGELREDQVKQTTPSDISPSPTGSQLDFVEALKVDIERGQEVALR